MRPGSWASADKVVVLATAAALLLALLLGNPYSEAWWLKCPLHALTGWQCPLCGMQRQLHALMLLRWGEAWRLNPALMLCYPYLALLLLGQLWPRFAASRLGTWCGSTPALLSFLGLMLLWGIARNVCEYL